MSDEQWLREGLASAVPQPPTNPERAQAAERRARRARRTTTLAVLGAAGAVAAAAVLTATLAGGDDGPDRNRVTSEPPSVVDCPPAKARDGVVQESEIDRPDPDAPTAVPTGATSARLCQGPGTTFEVPDGALVTDVDTLVTAINAVPEIGEPEVCTMDLGPGFRIAFGYGDGSTFVVSGQLYGCRTLVVGSGYRAHPAAAQEVFLTLLGEQNREGPTPAALVCPADRTPTGSVERLPDITSAIVCAGPDDPDPAPIPEADMSTLVNDMAHHLGGPAVEDCLTLGIIVAATGDGEPMVLPGTCNAYAIDGEATWYPSQQAWRLLRRVTDQ